MSLSISAFGGYSSFYPAYSASTVSPVKAVDRVDSKLQSAKTEPNASVKKGECQTCARRKYVDGSNEANVSFKAPGHISPENSAAKVMSHEQEHVANAIAEGNKDNKELVSATVSLQTSVCPECGRVYVSGGTTHTTIRSKKDSSNPYDNLQQRMNRNLCAGLNFDKSA